MGTQILHPQDFYTERIGGQAAVFPRRKCCNYVNSYSSPKSTSKPSSNPRSSRKQHQQAVRSEKQDQRKRFAQPEPPVPKRSSSVDIATGKTGLVMEKVTILRRGGSLDSKMKTGPTPTKNRVKLGSSSTGERFMYAGSAFTTSPEPSSLPLPTFPKKKQLFFDDSATRDLKRLLQLD